MNPRSGSWPSRSLTLGRTAPGHHPPIFSAVLLAGRARTQPPCIQQVPWSLASRSGPRTASGRTRSSLGRDPASPRSSLGRKGESYRRLDGHRDRLNGHVRFMYTLWNNLRRCSAPWGQSGGRHGPGPYVAAIRCRTVGAASGSYHPISSPTAAPAATSIPCSQLS